MKTISIGDIHGKIIWKLIDPNLYDKIIFVGDYVDDWNYSDEIMLNNLLDIIEFKKKYPDKVVLILGNHDIQYLFSYGKYGCSGFRPSMAGAAHMIFNENKKLFQASFSHNTEEGEYLWTHAGAHQGWYDFSFVPDFIKPHKLEDIKLEYQLEAALLSGGEPIFDIGHRRGGNKSVGGIFWADKALTADKPLKGYHQIVGHSKVKKITTIDVSYHTSITYIDCLGSDEGTFYELNLY